MHSRSPSLLAFGTAVIVALTACKSDPGEAAGTQEQADAESHILAEKGHLLPPGTRLNATLDVSTPALPLTISAGEQQMTGTMTMVTEETTVGQIVSASEARFEITERRSENTMTVNGNESPQPSEPNPLEGETVTFTLQDGELEVVIKPEIDSGEDITVTLEGDVVIHRALEHFTDFSVEVDGQIGISGSPHPGVTFEATGPVKMTRTIDLSLP